MAKLPKPSTTRELLNYPGPVLTLNQHHAGIAARPQYTTDEAPGAWRNGTRVVKVASVPKDAHQDGAPARVLGSIGRGGTFGYFVEWDDAPGVPTFIVGHRLALQADA